MAAPIGNSNAIGNPGGGRPTVYNKKFCKIAYQLCLLGSTDAEMAEAFEVTEQTIINWRKDFIEFFLACKNGKILAVAEVADKLFKKATGYSHSDVDIKMYEGQIIITKIKKHYAPDTAAAIFLLKNKAPDKWRDKTENVNRNINYNTAELTPDEIKRISDAIEKEI